MKVSTNGRYMRKRVARKSAMSRAQRAHERDKVRSRLEGETVESGESNGENSEDHDDQEQQEQKDEAETPLRSLNGRERKRRKDLNYEPRESPKKRSRLGHGEETDSVSASDRPSLFRVPPLSTTRFGSLACRRPNPMNLARSNWVPKTYHEPDAASDSGFLSVPKDLTRLRTTDSHPLENAENWRRRFSRVPIGADEEDLPLSPVGALTFKPSPGNYAKRRWSSEVWASNATRNSSPSPSDRSDASQEIFDDDDDSDSVDINVDYKKRYSIYFITQREREVGDIDLSSWEEVRLTRYPLHWTLIYRGIRMCRWLTLRTNMFCREHLSMNLLILQKISRGGLDIWSTCRMITLHIPWTSEHYPNRVSVLLCQCRPGKA